MGAWLGACVRACVGGWVRPCVRPCAFHLSDDEPRPLTSPAPRPPPHCIVLRPAVSLCHPPSTTPTTTGAPHTTRMPARTPCLHTAHTHIPTQTHTHTHTHTHTRAHTHAARSHPARTGRTPHTAPYPLHARTLRCPLPGCVSGPLSLHAPPPSGHGHAHTHWRIPHAHTHGAHPTHARPHVEPIHTPHTLPLPPPHPRSTTCACPRHTTTRRLLPGSSPVGSREFEGGDGVGVLGYVHIE